MAAFQADYTWTLTSTGTAKAYQIRAPHQAVTFGYETSSGCTATFALQHRMGSSDGPYSVISSQALSTGEFMTDQFAGPLHFVRPRIVAHTAGSTHVMKVYLKAV